MSEFYRYRLDELFIEKRGEEKETIELCVRKELGWL